MSVVERARAAWRLLNDRRQVVGWKGGLNLRALDKLITSNQIDGKWPTITINPSSARYDLSMRTGNSSDLLVASQVFKERNYAVIEGLRNVRTIVDCGANAGYASAYLLTSYPAARVIAVEPDLENWRFCSQNLRRYGKRATVVHAAVWGSEKRLAITTERDDREWGRAVKELVSPDSVTVSAITMHRLIEQCGGSADIVKMDVEWAELDIFAADTSWLSSVRNLAIELHDEDCKRVFFNAMKPWSYDLKLDNELTVCFNLRPK
ncbi:MAG TPA: FkbM family methyltransferase [Bryobacteraceae bacterium]|jgi:FkbM family methyltransferase|nr:FkbM family methyltransferase [Bryobacteraceae bacterium]